MGLSHLGFLWSGRFLDDTSAPNADGQEKSDARLLI